MIPQILGPISFAWTYFMLKHKNITLDTLPWEATTFIFGRVLTSVCLYKGLTKNPCSFPWITWGDPKGSYRKPLPIFTLKIGRSKILTRTVRDKSSHYLPPFFPGAKLGSYSILPPKKSKMASWKSDFLKRKDTPPKTVIFCRKIHDYFQMIHVLFQGVYIKPIIRFDDHPA